MPLRTVQDRPAAAPVKPRRWAILLGEGFVSLGAVVGTLQLVGGVATPPLSALEPLGLSSWVLPGIWLFGSVAIPSGFAAVVTWRRWRWASVAVLVASALLAIELAVQIPFVGFNILQPVLGAVAVLMAALAWSDLGGESR